MRALKIVGVAIGAVIVFIALLLVIGIPSSFLTAQIEARVERAAGKTSDAFSIEHISVTGGTIVFSNLRDRVENRIETVNADITIDADRKAVLSGSARRNGYPLKFEVKAALPASPIERQNIPAEIKIDAPDLLRAPLTAKAEARLNGSVVMINGVTGALGDAAFNGWASVDLSSKPLVKLDLDFQKLAFATKRSTGKFAS